MFEIVPERPEDGPSIERLLDRAFEPARRTRPSYALRAGAGPVASLGFVARRGAAIGGTIRFWPVRVGERTPALLLGPIAVDPDVQGHGLGARLVRRGLAAARTRGHRIVVAIGVRRYLGRFGFAPARPRGLELDAAVEDARFLALELVPGALAGVRGPLAPGGRLRRRLEARRRPAAA